MRIFFKHTLNNKQTSNRLCDMTSRQHITCKRANLGFIALTVEVVPKVYCKNQCNNTDDRSNNNDINCISRNVLFAYMQIQNASCFCHFISSVSLPTRIFFSSFSSRSESNSEGSSKPRNPVLLISSQISSHLA